jgi:hypothetical protein
VLSHAENATRPMGCTAYPKRLFEWWLKTTFISTLMLKKLCQGFQMSIHAMASTVSTSCKSLDV